MSDFKEKLKRLVVSSFYGNKTIQNNPNKKLIKNNSVNYKFKKNNDISDYIIIDINNKNKQNNIKKLTNYNTNKASHRISLYKKYKKYKSKPKKNISRNIINNFKIQNSTSSYFYDHTTSSQINNNIPSYNSKNSILSNMSTLNNFYIKQNTKNGNNYNLKGNTNFKNNSLYKIIKKEKPILRRVENKIIKKIELIENQNKENKVKNLLINRPPRMLNNDNYKFNINDYSYFMPSSRYKDSKNIKDVKKNSYKNNFLNLDNLNDIIFSIKNKNYLNIRKNII